MKVAGPSLSQTSCQFSTETESPNHWWASSWTSNHVCARPSDG